MGRPKVVIFDQDGTLMDSAPGVMHCFRFTGERYGRTELSDELLRTGLGGDFVANIMRILELEPSQLEEAVHTYADEYAKKGICMAVPFEGVREMLEGLREEGYAVAVATMMVEEYAKAILQAFGLLDMFDVVKGTDLTKAWTKREIIQKVLDEFGMDATDAWYVGDSPDDVISAKALDMPVLGAVYGYGLTEGSCEEGAVPHADCPKAALEFFRVLS